MDTFAQALIQGLFLLGAVGVLGLPFFVWRRPPSFYWRCPKCRHRNDLSSRSCSQCERVVAQEELGMHLRADWSGFDLVAIFLVAWFVSVVVWSFLLAAMGRLPMGAAPTSDVQTLLTPDLVWPLEFIRAALFPVLTVWMLNGRFRWSLEEVGMRTRQLGNSIALGAGVGAALFLVGELYDQLAVRIPFLAEERQNELALLPSSPGDPLWIVIAPTLLALTPLGSELFYRGMLYRLFRSRYSFVPAMLASAFVYAVTSGSLLSFLPFMVMGMVNAYLFERTGSLVPGIVSSVVSSAISLVWLFGRDFASSS